MTKGKVRTGTAGWVFEPWRGTFYPEGLVQKKELAHAGSRLTSIEINATFRATQKPESFARWASETPDDFQFSVKGPQLVTHIKRLKGVDQILANFFGSGPLALGSRLGPFVWQLPPNLAFDADVFSTFLALLPRDIEAYLALAGKSDGAKGAPYLDATGVETIRHAVEPRHPSFDTPEARALFERHNVARVIADTADNPSRALTADFAYCRLQGPARPDATAYTDADIKDWAETISGWQAKGLDTYAYFVHEHKLHAPQNAISLRQALGIILPGD